MRRVLRVASWLVGLLAVVLAGLNAALLTPWPLKWMNGDPEHLRVSYRSAWTFWPPLAIHVEDFDVSFQDPDTQVQVQAAHLGGYLSWPALRALRLEARGITASGVVFKVRPRVVPGDTTVNQAWLPAIDGFPSLEKLPGEAWPQLITFVLRDFELTSLREVWVGEVRYRGDGRVNGSMVFEPLRSVRLEDVAVVATRGEVTRGDQPLLKLERLSARVDLARLPFEGLSLADLKKLTATISLAGRLDSASIANFAVRSAPWLRVTGADGAVDVDVALVRGVLQEGSTFSAKAPDVTVSTSLLSLSGQGELRLSIKDAARRLDLVLLAPRVTATDKTLLMRAERFRLVSTGPVDLAAPDVFDGELTLTQARADDLRVIDRFLPRATGFSVVSGRALVNATLALDSTRKTGTGRLEASLIDLELAGRAARLTGQGLVTAQLRALDLSTGVMRLDGSAFELTGATVFADQRRYDGFWLKVRAPEWQLSTGPQGWTTAAIEFELQHLQPVMGLVQAQVPIPFPVRLMSEHHDVSGSASLRVAPHRTALTDVRVHATALDVWADLEVRDTPGLWGAVLVKSLPVIAGLEWRGLDQTTVLSDAVPWFHKWRATAATRLPAEGARPRR